jgi:hypothetical protein
VVLCCCHRPIDHEELCSFPGSLSCVSVGISVATFL